MATVTITAPARVTRIRPARVVATVSPASLFTRDRVNAWTTGPLDQLVVIESKPGQVRRALGELRSAVLHSASEVLNGVGEMRFTVPVDDPTLVATLCPSSSLEFGTGRLDLSAREVEWWRDGAVRWVGPIVAAEIDAAAGVVECTAYDLGWYLSRRVMGAAERFDHLGGVGGFDTPASRFAWTESGGVTFTVDTTDKVRGPSAALLEDGGAITHTFRHEAVMRGGDTTVRITAMVKAASTVPIGSRLLSISAVPVGFTGVWRPLADNDVTTTIDTPLGEWTRHSAYCLMRAGLAHDVTVVLWAPTSAAIRFDDVRCLRNDTTGFTAAENEDLTTHGTALIDHAQRGYGKASFNLKHKVLSVAGTAEAMGVRHLEHSSVLDLLDGYTSREDGFDWWINPQNRTVCFAARRGVDRADVPLSDRNVLAGGWVQDESRRASAVIVLGEGSDVDRPEGGYDLRTGGMVYDYVHRPALSTPLAALDPLARSLWDQLSPPQVALAPVRVPLSWWEDFDVSPGDRYPMHYRVGVLRPGGTDEWFRVQRITHEPITETLELA